jgi:CO/xanthine dehydrogenase FAD-binding subunit
VDLNTVREVCDARDRGPWRRGDAWLAGGTYLFSEPQPHLRRLVDLTALGWPPVHVHPDGAVEIAATCTIAELSRWAQRSGLPAAGLVEACCRAFLASFKVCNVATVGGNLCNALPAGPMISLTAALDGSCLIYDQAGTPRTAAVLDLVTGPGRTSLSDGDLLRSITLPAAAVTGPAAGTGPAAFRQTSLYPLGRSAALLIGTQQPAAFTLTITASTPRPVRLTFETTPTAGELAAAIEDAVPVWYDDVHGRPAWRRHMTLRLAEEIRAELAGP